MNRGDINSECEKGYQGILCAMCVTNYAKQGSTSAACQPCAEKEINVFTFTMILFITFLVILTLVL